MSGMPDYRLYTSRQAAERVGGDLTESLFDRLAASGEVEVTYIGNKIRWTDAQIAALVAHHARGGSPASETQVAPPARSPRTNRPVPAPRTAQSVTPLKARPGRRYGRTA